jgi:hypothetical protein
MINWEINPWEVKIKTSILYNPIAKQYHTSNTTKGTNVKRVKRVWSEKKQRVKEKLEQKSLDYIYSTVIEINVQP